MLLKHTSRCFLYTQIATVIIMCFFSIHLFGKEYSIKSPNEKLVVNIDVSEEIQWSVKFDGEELLQKNVISLKLTNGIQFGIKPIVIGTKSNSKDEVLESTVPVRNRFIKNNYNELTINFNKNYSISFRVFDDGAAYRFETNLKNKEVEVESETAEFNFAGNYRVFFPEDSPTFMSHYECSYKDTVLSGISEKECGSLPVLFSSDKGTKIVITEADLFDYPNMFLFGTGGPKVTAAFPKYVLETKPVSDRNEKIVKEANYIAKTEGSRTFPWRVVIIAENDKDLLETDMVYKLSTPSVIKNTSWIKPGKVAWDWWNALNIFGVDFKSGINTNTYKYYIDFASKYGLDYIILDEGWSLTTHNLIESIPEIDIKELIDYGKKKNVGVILWVLWNALNENMEKVLDQYAVWGAAGIKVDFMQRGDQYMVNYYERTASEAAKRSLLVDFHGAYKPSGLTRKYPNMLSNEGVKGLEHCKWSNDITPKHCVTLPFTRMVAGPMDFTPGAMKNAGKDNFRIVFTEPMSQGTRCLQAAMYIVYDSPLMMLADNPSNYMFDSVYTSFISRIPTTWDLTEGLESKAGEYVSVARKSGDKWYIAAMTDWNKRELRLPLSFLESGNYSIEFVEDGVNADKHASDYKLDRKLVRASDTLKINLASGGGFAGIITPIK